MAQNFQAAFVQVGESIDYTPVSAVVAGQVVVQGSMIGVAKTPIAAGALGALAVTLPERGDRVRETQDGKTLVYEVMAPGKEPHYRFSDVYRRTLRVHTRQVAVEG